MKRACVPLGRAGRGTRGRIVRDRKNVRPIARAFLAIDGIGTVAAANPLFASSCPRFSQSVVIGKERRFAVTRNAARRARPGFQTRSNGRAFQTAAGLSKRSSLWQPDWTLVHFLRVPRGQLRIVL